MGWGFFCVCGGFLALLHSSVLVVWGLETPNWFLENSYVLLPPEKIGEVNYGRDFCQNHD